MNTRDYKTFYKGGLYHLYNRGNNKESIFLDEQDNLSMLYRLAIILNNTPFLRESSKLKLKPLPEGCFSLISYCLMPNHYHFCIRQNSEIKLDRLITKLSTSYAKYFNKKYSRVGNLFQDAFKSKRIDTDANLVQLSAYIHCNPSQPFDYKFSSLNEYLNPGAQGLCDTSIILNYFDNKPKKYQNYIETYLKHKDSLKDTSFDE
jgi:REP element-mobilizing transposase RayT